MIDVKTLLVAGAGTEQQIERWKATLDTAELAHLEVITAAQFAGMPASALRQYGTLMLIDVQNGSAPAGVNLVRRTSKALEEEAKVAAPNRLLAPFAGQEVDLITGCEETPICAAAKGLCQHSNSADCGLVAYFTGRGITVLALIPPSMRSVQRALSARAPQNVVSIGPLKPELRALLGSATVVELPRSAALNRCLAEKR